MQGLRVGSRAWHLVPGSLGLRVSCTVCDHHGDLGKVEVEMEDGRHKLVHSSELTPQTPSSTRSDQSLNSDDEVGVDDSPLGTTVSGLPMPVSALRPGQCTALLLSCRELRGVPSSAPAHSSGGAAAAIAAAAAAATAAAAGGTTATLSASASLHAAHAGPVWCTLQLFADGLDGRAVLGSMPGIVPTTATSLHDIDCNALLALPPARCQRALDASSWQVGAAASTLGAPSLGPPQSWAYVAMNGSALEPADLPPVRASAVLVQASIYSAAAGGKRVLAHGSLRLKALVHACTSAITAQEQFWAARGWRHYPTADRPDYTTTCTGAVVLVWRKARIAAVPVGPGLPPLPARYDHAPACVLAVAGTIKPTTRPGQPSSPALSDFQLLVQAALDKGTHRGSSSRAGQSAPPSPPQTAQRVQATASPMRRPATASPASTARRAARASNASAMDAMLPPQMRRQARTLIDNVPHVASTRPLRIYMASTAPTKPASRARPRSASRRHDPAQLAATEQAHSQREAEPSDAQVIEFLRLKDDDVHALAGFPATSDAALQAASAKELQQFVHSLRTACATKRAAVRRMRTAIQRHERTVQRQLRAAQAVSGVPELTENTAGFMSTASQARMTLVSQTGNVALEMQDIPRAACEGPTRGAAVASMAHASASTVAARTMQHRQRANKLHARLLSLLRRKAAAAAEKRAAWAESKVSAARSQAALVCVAALCARSAWRMQQRGIEDGGAAPLKQLAHSFGTAVVTAPPPGVSALGLRDDPVLWTMHSTWAQQRWGDASCEAALRDRDDVYALLRAAGSMPAFWDPSKDEYFVQLTVDMQMALDALEAQAASLQGALGALQGKVEHLRGTAGAAKLAGTQAAESVHARAQQLREELARVRAERTRMGADIALAVSHAQAKAEQVLPRQQVQALAQAGTRAAQAPGEDAQWPGDMQALVNAYDSACAELRAQLSKQRKEVAVRRYAQLQAAAVASVQR